MKYLEKMTKKRLGEVLLEEGLINADQVAEALNLQKKSSKRMGELLVELGYVSEQDIARTLAVQFQLPYISLREYRLDKDLICSLPKELLHDYQIVPLDKMGGILIVVMAGFITRDVMEQIQKLSGCELAIYVGIASEVQMVLNENCPLPTDKISERSKEIRREEMTEQIVRKAKAVESVPEAPAAPIAPAAAPRPGPAPAAPQRPPGAPPIRPAPVQQPPARVQTGAVPPGAPRMKKPTTGAIPTQPGAKKMKPPSTIFKTPGQPATIHREEDGSKTYEISALNVEDQNEWNKVLQEADKVADEAKSGDDWLKMFDDAEAAVKDDIKKKLEEGDEPAENPG